MHNANQILMGHVPSTAKEIDNRKGTAAAGLRVCLKSDGTVTTATADGVSHGVSCGKDLSNTDRVAIVRTGENVPVKLATGFTPTVGAQVAFSDTTGEAMGYTGSGDSYVNAVYASAALDALNEDGTITEDGAAYIDMVGGL